MLITKENQIMGLYSECLMRCSKKIGRPANEVVLVFQKYHIYDYVSTCFDFLNFYGIDYVIHDIEERIRTGRDFKKK